MSPADSGTSKKRARQRAKRERAALSLLCKSVEQQVLLAYAKVPKEASALSQARLDIRASLVSRGYLTVEELESLPKRAAIATAVRRVTEQTSSIATPPSTTAE